MIQIDVIFSKLFTLEKVKELKWRIKTVEPLLEDHWLESNECIIFVDDEEIVLKRRSHLFCLDEEELKELKWRINTENQFFRLLSCKLNCVLYNNKDNQ
jgi:hypothetical protein